MPPWRQRRRTHDPPGEGKAESMTTIYLLTGTTMFKRDDMPHHYQSAHLFLSVAQAAGADMVAQHGGVYGVEPILLEMSPATLDFVDDAIDDAERAEVRRNLEALLEVVLGLPQYRRKRKSEPRRG